MGDNLETNAEFLAYIAANEDKDYPQGYVPERSGNDGPNRFCLTRRLLLVNSPNFNGNTRVQRG